MLLRGVIYRENYTPYLPFSSVLSYVRKTYSSANSTEQYMLSIQNDLYSDFNGDGVTDCLLLLADAEGRVRIPLILSYEDQCCQGEMFEEIRLPCHKIIQGSHLPGFLVALFAPMV